MEVFEHVVNWDPELEPHRTVARAGRQTRRQCAGRNRTAAAREADRAANRRLAQDRPLSRHVVVLIPRAGGQCVRGTTQHMERPVFSHTGGEPFHDHKGFNWMALRERLARQFDVERVLASPFTWLGPRLATQAWFVLRRR